MGFATRTILILSFLLSIGMGAFAQGTPATTGTSAKTPEVPESVTPAATTTLAEPSSEKVLEQFNALLRDRPPEVGTILATEPALLTNEAFLSGYPELARFVGQHPEIRSNPRFYLRDIRVPGDRSVFEQVLEPISVGGVLLFLALAMGWFIRTLIEQRRWSRLSRIQTEVHNKILDRFATSQELLEYVRSSAGTKFLESAPIPLHAGQNVQNAPLNRIIWSIQLGLVIAVGSLGMLGVSMRFEKEAAQGFFAIGAVAFCVGAGFIVSGLVSIFLSRRLGLWQPPSQAAANGLDEG